MEYGDVMLSSGTVLSRCALAQFSGARCGDGKGLLSPVMLWQGDTMLRIAKVRHRYVIQCLGEVLYYSVLCDNGMVL